VTILTGLHNRAMKFLGKCLLVMVCIKVLAGMTAVKEEPIRVQKVMARTLHAGDKLAIGPHRYRINEIHIDRKTVRVVYIDHGAFVRLTYRTTDKVRVLRAS
jgi:hypothetical protein